MTKDFLSHLELMNAALAASEKSDHKAHPVGACLTGKDFQISKANFWPGPLNGFGSDHRLGNSSTTIHAEVGAIFASPASTQGATLYLTDLPCPNCAKLLVEAGLSAIYINSDAHEKALGKKMLSYFEGVSLAIFSGGGMKVFEINRTNKTITLLNNPAAAPVPEEYPAQIRNLNPENFSAFIAEMKALYKDAPFAAALGNKAGQGMAIAARVHRARGMSLELEKRILTLQSKYNPSIQPFNRIFAAGAREGITLNGNYLYASRVPTAREWVNFIGHGFYTLTIGDKTSSRDEHGIQAMEQLIAAKVVRVQ